MSYSGFSSGVMEKKSLGTVTIDCGHEVVKDDGPSKLKGGWSSAIFIIFVEVAERFAYYGLAGNLITYLMKEMGQPLSTAAQNVNIWVGVSALFPIAGAFIADAYLGRFPTILVSSIIYFLGMVLLTISVSSAIPNHSEKKKKVLFFTALYILAIGEGGHKPCVQTFAADQFDEDLPEQKIAKSSFFNWWYFGVAAAATASVFFVIYLQDNVGWTWGTAVLALSVAIALVVFLMGVKRYRSFSPVGSPFTQVVQVLVAAIRKRHITSNHGSIFYWDHDSNKCSQLARTNRFRFLDKAAMVVDTDSEDATRRNPWRLCSVNQVEEVKLVLGLIPVWLSCLMFTAVQAQSHTFFTKQGSTMVRSIGSKFQIPPASFQGFQGLTILAAAIAYDRLFVPVMRNFTGHPSGITILQRIGFGLLLSILNMVVAGLVETERVKIAVGGGKMHIWWLLPQYMICGISDLFVVVGLQELFYDHVPEPMRSVGAAAHISIIGIGSFISSAVIAIVQHITSRSGHKWLDGTNINTAKLNYFYWVLAGLSGLNLCIYVCIAMRFQYKKLHIRGAA